MLDLGAVEKGRSYSALSGKHQERSIGRSRSEAGES
jgi:hypothetical protein